MPRSLGLVSTGRFPGPLEPQQLELLPQVFLRALSTQLLPTSFRAPPPHLSVGRTACFCGGSQQGLLRKHLCELGPDPLSTRELLPKKGLSHCVWITPV